MQNCIFLTFDDSYYKYATICLNSLSANYPDHPPVKIIYTGENKDITEHISNMINVELLDYKLDMTEFDKLNICQLGSYMVYVRFVLWTEIFDQFDKVLYLDCDTIILKPFPELFAHNEFFAVSDNGWQKVFEQKNSTNNELLALLKKDKINFDQINSYMINSGLFIIPKKYRTKEYLEQLWTISANYNDYIAFADQSIISIWMYLNNISMSNDYQYNFQTQFILKDTLHKVGIENIKIMHYSGWKPDRNFDELLIPAKYIFKIMDLFNEYK